MRWPLGQDLPRHGVGPAAGDVGGADLAGGVVLLRKRGVGLAEADGAAGRAHRPYLRAGTVSTQYCWIGADVKPAWR